MDMCAIAGVIGLEVGQGLPERMLQTMAHRGPDGKGIWQRQDCTLLHSRLAIVDPAGGAQPMQLHWAGEDYCLVYNGELYNTPQLRRELEQAGHSFLGHSDTEVVLHAYAQWGSRCVERFNGIFAMAVWEEEKGRLFLARDRIGVKPIFYAVYHGGFLFASEIKTILAYPGFPRRLDAQGVMQLLLLGPGRLPGSGIFQGIHEVQPGFCGWYDHGRLELRQYWKLRDRIHRESLDDTIDHVRALVTDAVRSQMVADVPLGTFLSGGLDSSLISAICAREMEEKGQRLHTFSLDYQDNDRYFQTSKFQPNSDPDFIRRMEGTLNTHHHWTVLGVEELLQTLEDATIARDLPGMADVDFSLLAFCRQIRPHVKVALSGECADEIFGGYPWYRDPQIRAREGFPWAQNTAQRQALLAPGLREKCNGRDFVMDAYRSTCRQSDILPENSPLERRMKEMMNLNFQWFMQTLLDRKDRMSMYTGLEVRVPFCDYRIAEYLYGVPWHMKDLEGAEKGLLRRAMEGWLPREVLWRKKSPYPKTFHPEYAARLRLRLDALLRQKDAAIFTIVDPQALQVLCGEDQPWPWYGQLMATPQTMAYFLQLDFWLRHYGVDIVA